VNRTEITIPLHFLVKIKVFILYRGDQIQFVKKIGDGPWATGLREKKVLIHNTDPVKCQTYVHGYDEVKASLIF
jgi:hypothetical protein